MLAFVEIGNTGPLEYGGVHKGVLAAAVTDNKAKALLRVVPLDRPRLLDRGLGHWPTPGRVRRPTCQGRRGRAAVDADDLGDLRSFLPGRDTHLQRLAGLDRGDAVPFEDRVMK